MGPWDVLLITKMLNMISELFTSLSQGVSHFKNFKFEFDLELLKN